jgi:hypothetical protein
VEGENSVLRDPSHSQLLRNGCKCKCKEPSHIRFQFRGRTKKGEQLSKINRAKVATIGMIVAMALAVIAAVIWCIRHYSR